VGDVGAMLWPRMGGEEQWQFDFSYASGVGATVLREEGGEESEC
jgi:hypothetical protein